MHFDIFVNMMRGIRHKSSERETGRTVEIIGMPFRMSHPAAQSSCLF